MFSIKIRNKNGSKPGADFWTFVCMLITMLVISGIVWAANEIVSKESERQANRQYFPVDRMEQRFMAQLYGDADAPE